METLISVQQIPSRWSQILSSPIILLVMRSEALFLNEVKKNMMKFNIKCRLPEWISFFYANLHVFDHLPPPPHVTQTSQPDFQKLSTDTLTACGKLLYSQPMLSHIGEWKNKPKKGSYICIAHAGRHFSCCFAVKGFHPGIKLSFWKWDDNRFGLCFCEQGYPDWKNRRETVKIQVICTKHKCWTKYSTDYIIVYNRELECLRTVV